MALRTLSDRVPTRGMTRTNGPDPVTPFARARAQANRSGLCVPTLLTCYVAVLVDPGRHSLCRAIYRHGRTMCYNRQFDCGAQGGVRHHDGTCGRTVEEPFLCVHIGRMENTAIQRIDEIEGFVRSQAPPSRRRTRSHNRVYSRGEYGARCTWRQRPGSPSADNIIRNGWSTCISFYRYTTNRTTSVM